MAITLGSYLLPILQVLASHGPDVIVPSATVKAAVQASVGLPEDVTKAAAMVDNAAFDLKQRGCLTTHGRAGWALTALGLEVAQGSRPLPTKGQVKTDTTPTPAPVATPPVSQVTPPRVEVGAPAVTQPEVTTNPPVSVVPTVTQTVTVSTPTPVPASRATDETLEALVSRVTGDLNKPRISLPVVPASDWLSDDGLRQTVISNTPCFGQWCPTDVSCNACDVASYCMEAQAQVLRALADRLTVRSMQAEAKRLHTAVAASMGVTARAPAALVPGQTLVAPVDGTCARTGKPYSAGQTVMFVPGVGNVLRDAT